MIKKFLKRKEKIVLVSKIIESDGYAVLEDHIIGALDKLVGKKCKITIEIIEEKLK